VYLPVAAFSIVVLGFIANDSKADDFESSTWLRLNSDVTAGRKSFVSWTVGTTSDDTSGVQLSGRKSSATHAPEESRQRIIKRAYELIGTPYKWGEMSLSKGFDCSGLLVYLFRSEVGLVLPRTTVGMVREDYLSVSRQQLRPGDAVFFAINEPGRVSHVGLYVGNNQFIHAPRTGKNIRVDTLKNNYWSDRYYGARRFDRQS